MPPLKFSIVTVVLNRRVYIRQAIENVLSQGYPNFEHIIIDGGSTDGTLDVLREYPHLRWISEKDGGSVFALNKGIAMVTGDVFGWLNSDETYLPKVIAKAARYLEDHPDWGMIYGSSIFVDGSGGAIGRNRLKRFDLRRQIAGFNAIPAPSAMFMRTSALKGVGGAVDERWQHAYDHDLWIRVAKKYRVEAVPERFSTFGIHAASGISSAPQHAERETKLLRRHHGGERRLVDRMFWARYRDFYVFLYKRTKWKRMIAKAGLSKKPGTAAGPAQAKSDDAGNGRGASKAESTPLLRTLHVVYSLNNSLGGSIHAALGICEFLAEAGHVAEIVATNLPEDDVAYLAETYPKVKVRMFPRSFPRRYANSREFRKWLRENLGCYDLVECHSAFNAMTSGAAEICREMGKPYFVRPHGSLDPFDLRKHALLKRLVGPLSIRPMLAGASAVVLTSDMEAQRMVTYGAKVNRVVLPLPVVLPAAEGDRAAFRRRHGIPEGAFVVMFMSRIDYKKGLDFLIPALSDLRKTHPNLWFLFAGSGQPEFTASVKGWLAEGGIADRTSLVGFVFGKEKGDALAAADVFALPSMNENFGIVLIEAMHAGLPLLVSDEVYIHREISGHGAGVVCRPSVSSVTESLGRMIDGSVDLRAMGERGRDLVANRYRPEAATRLLLDTYRDALRKPA